MTKLEQLVSKITKEHIYIQTHNFPDPDAIATAFGLQVLLAEKGVSSTICYKGKIDRGNCKSMLKHLHIDIENIDELNTMKSDDEVILVDAQKGNGNTYDIIGNEIASIDHHPTFENQEYRFADIRPDVGACASIIAEYFYENNIPLNKKMATALMYGIKIDTADMTRGVSELDLDIFHKLYFKCDHSILSYFSSNELQLKDLKSYSTAIDSVEIDNHMSFASTGSNCPDGLIATISDFIMALETVDFSVVYSFNDGGIKISVRSSKYSGINAGQVTMLALKGLGSGGGHVTMAGGFAPYSDIMSKHEMIKVIENNFKSVIDEMYYSK